MPDVTVSIDGASRERAARETTEQLQRRARAAGYLYQDVVAALMLARALIDGFHEVRIEAAERREVFDDHTVTLADQRPRLVQVKYSVGSSTLGEGDFANASGRLPIDKLMASAATEAQAGAEFRVFANWRPPDAEGRRGFLVPATATRIDPALATSLWRLDTAIWPDGEAPRWGPLGTFTREKFIAFCERFVIELEGPGMSADIADPGAMELRVLEVVRDELGVERPPNGRDPTDVAARLIVAAVTARSRTSRTFTADDIVRETGLLIDDGHLAAAFPLEAELFVRTSLIDQLVAAAGTDGTVLVTGSPGAGKSWALEAIVPLLQEKGYIVGRHYCFLEPGDPYGQQRVAVETMCSNLIAELRRDEQLRDIQVSLARDPHELEQFLQKARRKAAGASGDDDTVYPKVECRATGARIVLIVDGVDHVARVDPVTGSRDVNQFVLALAGVKLPPGVTLLVGSQPGAFLEPLTVEARELHPQPFDRGLIAQQLERLGVTRALEAAGVRSEQDRDALVDAFLERSAGNPLYVRYLAREVLDALSSGVALPEVLRADPVLPAGDLAAYYGRLLGPDGSVVGEQLAVLDFAVSPEELADILPMFGRDRISEEVRRLRPVLEERPGGAVRIYHESVRRFVIEQARVLGSLPALVDPVVKWLEGRGFYADDRAFRWLLPTLRRAGRLRDCLARVGPDFVARSVTELHPGAAVAANIRTATYAARDAGDLAKLAALAELRTAATTAYDERVEETEDYARTVVALRGADALGQRLLYDGRPARPGAIGLRMCALVDAAGGRAPWGEYLAMPSDKDDLIPEERQELQLDRARGWMRMRTAEDTATRIGAWLREPADVPEWYARGLAQLLREVHGADALRAVLATDGMTTRATIPFRIEFARALHDAGDQSGAAATGAEALAAGASGLDLLELLDCGVPAADLAASTRDPAELVAGALEDRSMPKPGAVNELVAAILVHAAAGRPLGPLRQLLGGEGWYRRWLRFVIDLGLVRQGRLSIIGAFDEVAGDTRPFVGQPRAIDLFVIAGTVATTLQRGFLMASPDERRQIVPRLLDVAVGTTRTIENTPLGAFTLGRMLELLESAADPELITLVADAVARRGGDVYGTHADDALRMARLWNTVGERARAEEEWLRAGRFLAAYGYHKDITIFSLLDGIEAIAKVDPRAARERALRVRRLTDLVTFHTDGDETRHAPGTWLRLLARIDAVLATRTLARTLMRDARVPNSAADNLDAVVLAAAPATVPPLVRHLLWRCVPARERAKERLAVVAELLASDRERGERAFAEAGADIEGDAEEEAAAIAALRQFADEHGLRDPGIGLTPLDPVTVKRTEDDPLPSRPAPREDGPFLPVDATPAALLLAIRRANLDRWDAPISQRAFAREFAAHLRRIGASAGEETVVTLMQELARARSYFDARVLFETVSDELREVYPHAAAEGYVLAWCAARRDWQVFGDPKDADLLDRALAIDEPRTFRRLAAESADAIDRYEYGMGVAQRIVEVLAHFGRVAEACAAWDAAFDVVAHRLPDLHVMRDIFALPDDPDHSDPTRAYGELLGALLTHSVYTRRAAAMSAVIELASAHRDVVQVALDTAIGPDAVLTDRVIALQLGSMVQIAPSDRAALRELARRAPFTAAVLAARILERTGEAAPRARPYIWTRPAVGADAIREALESDYDDRAERLATLWNDFPELVADVYWRQRRGDERHERIRRRQAEQQRSLTAPWVPPLHLHDWYRELFDIALGETLWGLREYLLKRGRWNREWEDGVFETVAPDARTTQARARSRILRPPGLLPEQAVAGRAEPVLETAGAFAGWVRAACIETQARAVDEGSASAGIETVVRSGLVPRGAAPNEPFVIAARRFLWHEMDRTESARRSPVSLVRVLQQMDCTAWDHVLAPVPHVRDKLGLRPAPLTKPLDLLDAEGHPAMSLRYWRMRPYNYDYGPATPLLTGVALFVRSDLWGRMCKEFGDLESLTVKTSIDLAVPTSS